MIKILLKILLVSAIIFSFTKVNAQDDDIDLNKIIKTQEQWEAIRDTLAIYAIKDLAKLDTLQMQIDSLRKVNEMWENRDCEAELYALVGATKEQVADFRIKFGETESRISSKTGSPDDVRRMYFDEVKNSMIRCLPEFSDRYTAMANAFSQYTVNETQTTTYTENQTQNNTTTTITEGTYMVERGDNLGTIAERFYGNSSFWPAIWDANKTAIVNSNYFYYMYQRQVANPNMIYAGQLLKIPALTEQQKNEALQKALEYRYFR